MALVNARVLGAAHLEPAEPITAIRGGSVFVAVTESANADAGKRHWPARERFDKGRN